MKKKRYEDILTVLVLIGVIVLFTAVIYRGGQDLKNSVSECTQSQELQLIQEQLDHLID